MIKTLKQRLALFLILPVAFFLFLTGFFGFLYARGIMLDEWREAAILKMQRAAHHIDMRLNRPVEWINMFHKTSGYRGDFAIQEWLINQLKELEGVIKVNLEYFEDRLEHVPMMSRGPHMSGRGMMGFHRARISEVTPPRYDAQTGNETVTLISDLKDESDRLVGRLEVSLRFDYLMQDIIKLGWWQSELACLVDQSGRYLAHTKAMEGRTQLGETNDPVELAVLERMKEKPFGTYLGPGHPPDLVSGFYRIKQAPWVIVMFAPGEKILASIVKFRFYYVMAGTISIVFILLIIRFVAGKMARSIKEISQAAEQVAGGNYVDPLPAKGRDEIAHLTHSFNTMVEGLKERDFVTNTFGRYMDQEIARELMRRPEASRLGGEKREVAIFMSDIRDFTPLSESLSPEATISILNHYFSHMIEIIQKHQGIIVDFFGDGMLVFFDPLEGPVEPVTYRAVCCALEMQGSMEQFNAEMGEKGLPELKMGIGVNTGEVVVGNIGSESRAKYGIVGSAVNITQRIQSKAKGGEVVISESVYHRLSEEVAIKRSFSTSLKGIQGEIKLFVMDGT